MEKEVITLAVTLVILLSAVSANTSPIINDLEDKLVICESSSLLYSFDATDAEGGPLTIGISPSGPFFIRAADSETATTRIEIYSKNLTKAQSNQVYAQTIFISDGLLIDTKNIQINVLETNNPPRIDYFGVQTLDLNKTKFFSKQITLADIESNSEDSGSFVFNATFPSSEFNFSVSQDGLIKYFPIQENLGLHEITICATDSGVENIEQKIGFCGDDDLRESSCEKFQLAVVEGNAPPTILLANTTNLTDRVLGINTLAFEIYKFDPEGLIPDTYWYVDDVLKKISYGKAVDEFVYSFGCDVWGRHSIKVEITDGLVNDSLLWKFDVVKTACFEGSSSGEKIGREVCEEEWGCYDFGLCQNVNQSVKVGVLSSSDSRKLEEICAEKNWLAEQCGFQIRNCLDINECSSTINKPSEIQACQFFLEPSCSDRLKNCHDNKCEFLTDCGGPCNPCPTCTDGIKNQGEENIDCSGPCFKQCPVKVLSETEKNLKQIILIIILFLMIISLIQILRIIREKKKLEAIPTKVRKNADEKPKLVFVFAVLIFLILYTSSVSAIECFPRYECGPWSTCEDGIQSRVCEDKACGRRDIIERGFCDKPGCQPKIECGAWSDCIYTEKTDSLIKGKVSFGGYRNRICSDANGCIENFVQEGMCEESFALLLSEVKECNEDFLAVIDPTSQREVAKINLNSWKFNQLDIAFVQGQSEYCPSCYNTIKDESEEGVDCGQECKPCKKERKFLLVLSIILLWFFSTIFTLLSIREYVLLKRENTETGGFLEQ